LRDNDDLTPDVSHSERRPSPERRIFPELWILPELARLLPDGESFLNCAPFPSDAAFPKERPY